MKKLTEEQKLKKEHYYIGKTQYFLRNCDFCGILYDGQGAQFCSKVCMRLAAPIVKKGKDNASWKGGRPPCQDCGVIMERYDSERCQPCWFKYNRGANMWNYKGLVRTLSRRMHGTIKWMDWRESVFERDNYLCRECGMGGYVEPHHIIPVRELSEDSTELFDIRNGITLCRPCHMLTFGKEESLADRYFAMTSPIQ